MATGTHKNAHINKVLAELVGYVTAAQGIDEKMAIAQLIAIMRGDGKEDDRFVRSLRAYRPHQDAYDFFDIEEEFN